VGSVLHTSATRGRLYVCRQPTHIYLWYIIFASLPRYHCRIMGLFVALVSCVVPLFLHCGVTVARYSCVAPPPYDCTCNEVFMITDGGWNCFTLFVYYYGRRLELFYVICILLWTSVRIILRYLYIITDDLAQCSTSATQHHDT
jgi:hypothetical protein